MTTREHLTATALLAGIGALLLAFGARDAGAVFVGGAAIDFGFGVWAALSVRHRADAEGRA